MTQLSQSFACAIQPGDRIEVAPDGVDTLIDVAIREGVNESLVCLKPDQARLLATALTEAAWIAEHGQPAQPDA